MICYDGLIMMGQAVIGLIASCITTSKSPSGVIDVRVQLLMINE
jgi:hypothetical protein